jgi:hypothetical protein
MSLDVLPEDVILIILSHLMDLGLPTRSFLRFSQTEKRIWRVSNDLCRRTIAILYGQSSLELGYRLMDRMKTEFPEESIEWTSILVLMRRAYCFFGKENIVDLNPGDLWPSEGFNNVSIRHGIWRLVPGPWRETLYASNVICLHLQIPTYLIPGTYKVFLNIKLETMYQLLPLRFRVLPGPHVQQYWRDFPSGNFIGGVVGSEFDGYVSGLHCEIYVGRLDVYDGDRPVVFEVEDLSVRANRNISFHYLCYELSADEQGQDDEGWRFPSEHRPRPDAMKGLVYQKIEELKTEAHHQRQ